MNPPADHTPRQDARPVGAMPECSGPGPSPDPSPDPSPGGARLFAAATERNRQPILEVLSRVLPDRGLVLEVASGSGEHALWFAEQLRPLVWQPSDPDPACRRSIAAHGAHAGIATLEAPLDLDAARVHWPIERADAVVCINMTHISPWRATEGLIAGVARILPPGGVLYLYGPYRAAATPPPPPTPPSTPLCARATRTGACVLSRPWPKRPGRKAWCWARSWTCPPTTSRWCSPYSSA